jgi:hypothetical protein
MPAFVQSLLVIALITRRLRGDWIYCVRFCSIVDRVPGITNAASGRIPDEKYML